MTHDEREGFWFMACLGGALVIAGVASLGERFGWW